MRPPLAISDGAKLQLDKAFDGLANACYYRKMDSTSTSLDDRIATINLEHEQGCSVFTRLRMATTQRMSGCDKDHSQLVFAHLDAASVLHNALYDVLIRHYLTNLQFKVLLALNTVSASPITATLLATRSGVSKTAITNAIDAMEKNGLTERWRKPHDQRITQIRLTTVGRKHFEETLDDYFQTAANAARLVEKSSLSEALALNLLLKQGGLEQLRRRTDRIVI